MFFAHVNQPTNHPTTTRAALCSMVVSQAAMQSEMDALKIQVENLQTQMKILLSR
jgi:hypothetical protein